jgi:hypothetical protein
MSGHWIKFHLSLLHDMSYRHSWLLILWIITWKRHVPGLRYLWNIWNIWNMDTYSVVAPCELLRVDYSSDWRGWFCFILTDRLSSFEALLSRKVSYQTLRWLTNVNRCVATYCGMGLRLKYCRSCLTWSLKVTSWWTNKHVMRHSILLFLIDHFLGQFSGSVLLTEWQGK